MALAQSALSELLEAFRAGVGVDLIRESVHLVLQELIEAEAAERIGAAITSAARRVGPIATGAVRS
jgi:putative transposase